MKDPGKLLRLFRCLNLLSSSRRGYSIDELAERLGVSYRTVYRDFKIFEETGFELMQMKSKRYRLAKAQEISENITFNKEEADVLRQALMVVGDSSIRNFLMDKISMLSESAVKVNLFQKTTIATNLNQISTAISGRKQVILLDYQSMKSQNISNRIVEPFAFSDNGESVLCLEVKSKANKFFKLERIGQVEILPTEWQLDYLHQTPKQDIFNMSLAAKTEMTNIKLRMGLLSANLLREEFPLAANHIKPLSNYNEAQKIFEFEAPVASFLPVGRFVLGFLDDIQVLEPQEFKTYLKDKLTNQMLLQL